MLWNFLEFPWGHPGKTLCQELILLFSLVVYSWVNNNNGIIFPWNQSLCGNVKMKIQNDWIKIQKLAQNDERDLDREREKERYKDIERFISDKEWKLWLFNHNSVIYKMLLYS